MSVPANTFKYTDGTTTIDLLSILNQTVSGVNFKNQDSSLIENAGLSGYKYKGVDLNNYYCSFYADLDSSYLKNGFLYQTIFNI